MVSIHPAPLAVDAATAEKHRAIFAATPAEKKAYKRAWKLVHDAAEPFTKLARQPPYRALDHIEFKKLADAFKEKVNRLKVGELYSPLSRPISAKISLLITKLGPTHTTEITETNSSASDWMRQPARTRDEYDPSEWRQRAIELRQQLEEAMPPASCLDICSIQ